MMPKLDGISALKLMKQDASLRFIPVILLTAKADKNDVVAGLEAGGDDYLTKPFDQAALIARVRSMLRIKALHDTVQEQAGKLQQQTEQLAEWNRTLEERVATQVAEIERVGRLRRFLAPQLAEVIASADGDEMLKSHRREVTVVFCDLRGFTAFTEIAEPEEVMAVLREYHETLGELIYRYEGTLGALRRRRDSDSVQRSDPAPGPARARGPAWRSRCARASVPCRRSGSKRGHSLGFGVGIALGYATLGQIGFDRRFDYAAIGSVTNLAVAPVRRGQGRARFSSASASSACSTGTSRPPMWAT